MKERRKTWNVSLGLLKLTMLIVAGLGGILTLYCFFLASDQGISLSMLIQKDAGYNIYFMYAMLAIVCAAELQHLYKELNRREHIERSMLQIMLVLLVQSLLLNPVTSILLFVFLFKNLKGNQRSLRKLLSVGAAHGSRMLLLVNAAGLLLLVSIIYMTLFSLVA